MHSVDGDAYETVDRYRAAYDAADGANEPVESFRYMVAWFLEEVIELWRVAWAVTNPLMPFSPEQLIDAGDAGAAALHEILPQLRRFGQAILTQGNPSRLAELTGLSDEECRERERLRAAAYNATTEYEIETIRRWARILRLRLRVLTDEQRVSLLTEFQAELAGE